MPFNISELSVHNICGYHEFVREYLMQKYSFLTLLTLHDFYQAFPSSFALKSSEAIPYFGIDDPEAWISQNGYNLYMTWLSHATAVKHAPATAS